MPNPAIMLGLNRDAVSRGVDAFGNAAADWSDQVAAAGRENGGGWAGFGAQLGTGLRNILNPPIAFLEGATRPLANVGEAAIPFARALATGQTSAPPPPATGIPGQPAKVHKPPTFVRSEQVAQAATPNQTVTPAPSQTAFKDYMSRSQETEFDPDLRVTHNISRMLALVGMGPEAMQYMDLYYGLNTRRRQAIGQAAAQRAATGDLSGFIDMHNHEVPGAKKIVAYGKNADGSYQIKFEDNSEFKMDNSQLMQLIGGYQDPSLVGRMVQQQQKFQGELHKNVLLKAFEGQQQMAVEQFKALADHQSKLILKDMDLKGRVSMHPDQLGTGVYVSIGQQFFKGVASPDEKDPITGQPKLRLVPISMAPGMQAQPQAQPQAQAPAQPYTVSPPYVPSK